jgi:hypothetical protein
MKLVLLFIVFFYIHSCPNDMMEFKNYCIDKYEAPNLKNSEPFYFRTANEGEDWCKSKGKRLCTETEWVLSCSGNENRLYPYGNTYMRSYCNDDKIWRSYF